jgi:FAD-dependent monooxygenase
MAINGSADHLAETAERLDSDAVLIVGGGPAGLTLATTLAYYGVKSVVLERDDTTTRYQPVH